MLKVSLSSVGLFCASGFGALLMKGMLFGGMLIAGSLDFFLGGGGVGVLVLFGLLMVVGSGRWLERNGRLPPHTRSFLWEMAEGYTSERMFGVTRWLYVKLSPLCLSWQPIKRSW